MGPEDCRTCPDELLTRRLEEIVPPLMADQGFEAWATARGGFPPTFMRHQYSRDRMSSTTVATAAAL